MKAQSKLTKPLVALFALFSTAVVATAQVTHNGATIVIESGAKLVAESPSGAFDWPPQVPYGTAADDIVVRTNAGEIIRVGIVIPPMVMTCVPGPGGATYHSGADVPSAEAIPAFIKFVRRGAETFVPVDLLLEVSNSVPVIDGEFVTIGSEIDSISLVMADGGHPDFSSLRIRGERGSGQATGRRTAAAGTFAVDSFFDIFVDLAVTGAPGGAYDGVSFAKSRNVRLRSVLDVFDGVGFEPVGEAEVMDIAGCLQVGKLGSSGSDGVRLASKGMGKKGYDHYASMQASIQQLGTGGGVLTEGQSLSAFPFPPPPLPELPDLPPLSVVCTNTGGTVFGVCSSNAVRASEWVVEVWEGDALKAVGSAADETALFSMPASGFRPTEIHCAGASPRGNLAMSTTIKFQEPSEVFISGATAAVIGDCVKVSPRDPQVLLGGVNELVLLTSASSLCIDRVEFREHELDHAGLGNAVVTPLARGLLVDNVGLSGEDGIAIFSDDDNGFLPYRAELKPLDVQGSGGTFWVSSRDAEGNNVATVEYSRTSGGAAGKMRVDYNTASTVCRVTVMNDGQFVGAFDVALVANSQTEVCTIGGSPKLTACGKLRLGWPWELSCLVQEFDQAVMITPTGGSGMVGDEVRLLAPGATPQEVASIRSIELRAAGIQEFEVCGESHGLGFEGPLLPPAPTADWEFPGVGTEIVMAQEVYYTWDEASGTAVCVRKKIRDQVLTLQQGNRRTYSAIMDVHLEGVGGLVLTKDLELPGTFTVVLGENPFLGEDVQQYHVGMRNLLFTLPAGSDPEINQLSVALGSGFNSGGDVIVRKIPECELELQAILDILADFQLSGSFGGGGSVSESSLEVAHVVQRPSTAGGLAHMNTGQSQVSVPANGGLVLSNIGSSGDDGCSIQLPGVESLSIEFADLEILSGGHFSFEPRGQLKGGKVGASLGRCLVTRAPAGTDFYDIGLDVSGLSPSATSIEIYNAGALVASYPSGLNAISLQAFPSSAGLASISGCGKLSGRSSTPCAFVRFSDRIIFRAAGQPAVSGDEVRLLVHGLEVNVLTRMELRFANTAADVEITEEAMGLTGREITSTRGALATDHNSSRSNKTSSIAFNPDSDEDGDEDGGILVMRAPRSEFLDGQRQLWPLTCHLDPQYVVFEGAGSRLKFEAQGTINGDAEADYGALELIYNGDAFELHCDFAARGTNSARIAARPNRRIDKATPWLFMSVPTGAGISSVSIRSPSGGGGALPLAEVSAVPELYEPPFQEIECSYRLRFSEEVEVTVGDSDPVLAHIIDVRLENPTFVSQDIASLNLSGHRVKPLLIAGIGTGSFYGQGLAHSTTGGAQIEEADPGSGAPLVIHNIGHSGEDGIVIELDLGEGFWQKIEPLDLSIAGRSLLAGIENEPVDDDCDLISLSDNEPVDDDCDLIAAELLGAGDQTMELLMRSTRPSGSGVLVGTVSGNGFGAAVAISGDGRILTVGSITPQQVGSRPQLIGYGVLPATVIPGVGYVGESVAFEFDQPIVCTTTGGGSIVCDVIRICPQRVIHPRDPDAGHFGRMATAHIAKLHITDTTLLHLNKQEHLALGVAEMVALDGQLLLNNLGSSGEDGVRVPASKIHEKVKQLMMSVAAPSPKEDAGTFTVAPHGFIEGDPDRPLGESTLSLRTTSSRLPIRADFSALSASNVQAFVCDNRDNDCDGIISAPNGIVCEVHLDSLAPASLIAYGYIGDRPIPGGGVRPAGIVWEFDQPVEVTALGGEPGTGLMGRVIILTPSGDAPIETELQWVDLLSTGFASLTLLDSPSGGAELFDVWLEQNFTVQEIDQLDAADYELDHDDDGYNELEEFMLGFDPKKRDGRNHKPTLSMDVRGNDAFARMAYEFDPTRLGVRHDLEISPDLSDWVDMIVAPDMWRLVEEEQLGSGNLRQTWERTDPIDGHQQEYYRHRGHVTVLK